MQTLTSKLKRVGNVLAAVCTKTYHYYRPASLDGCIIWQEDAEDTSMHGNNHLLEQKIHGTIDYYTTTEYDPVIDNVQAVLEGTIGLAWDLSSVQYEDSTKLIHYEWDFWVA